MKFLIFLVLISSLHATPESVLIIGGGPSGLATAIVAKEQGLDVTLVEKREKHTRYQWLILDEYSLKLLEKWQVSIPEMHLINLGEERMGFVPIMALETALERRSLACGMKKIYGEFIDFKGDKTAHIQTSKGGHLLTYDILVAADGTHSRVRQALNIPMNSIGTSQGASALILEPQDTSTGFDLSPIVKNGTITLRRIKVPKASILMMQGNGSASEFAKHAEACGWKDEAKLIEKKKALIIEDISVTLQQAHTFSQEKNSVIIIGEAAASASFFQGLGCNTAFKTVEIAGKFFKERGFSTFNKSMKETTDAMVEDSKFLFE